MQGPGKRGHCGLAAQLFFEAVKISAGGNLDPCSKARGVNIAVLTKVDNIAVRLRNGRSEQRDESWTIACIDGEHSWTRVGSHRISLVEITNLLTRAHALADVERAPH